ncbi:MAG: iron-sulfur cluster assembly scaffold protein [Candidatus Pacebacteria bacterium]|nr:iron-sulfur cluster assembly scaffold protein [Candidatus Paceibacterota bacterium]NUQ57332.1 iron-sulfur cluster assembly scaffold protein [Candidatus Paceibacter sp.]
MADVDKWVYSDVVKDHFMHPRNFLANEPKDEEFDAFGEVGSFACGDIIKIWIRLDKETDKIKDIKWRTWGCATAIASASAFSEMLIKDGGMNLDEALKIKPQDIADYLGGLPARKFHCSILADKAFRKAVDSYRAVAATIKDRP